MASQLQVVSKQRQKPHPILPHIFRAPCMLDVHYLAGFSMKWIFSKESRFCFCSCSPQTQRRQGKIRWGSMVTTSDWAPLARPGEQPAPPTVLRSTVTASSQSLWPTEPWDFILGRMFWACKRFIMACSAEEPGGTWLDWVGK